MVAVRTPICGWLWALALACGVGPQAARADVVSDHPEWFAFTAPPSVSITPVPGYEVPTGFLIRLMPSVTAYGDLIQILADDLPLTVVYAGESELAQAESALQEHGLQPAEASWWDAGGLNSYALGDFGFSAMRTSQELLLMDAKFDIGKPLDDALPSKWALEQAGSCAFRPPLVLQRGVLEANGAGICLASTKVISMNPDLSQGQLAVIFKRYYGCTQLLWVQPLQGDGKGRVDTVFRFASDTVLLAGLYDVAQDSGNRLVMLENHKKLQEALPENVTLTPFPMPTPRASEGESAWPSYLHWVVTPGHLLVPVFATDDLFDPEAEQARQTEALEMLASLFPAPRVIDQISASTLLAVGLRLNGVLLPLPAGSVAPCAAPEQICTGNSIPTCPGCFDQCAEEGLGCGSPTAVEICEVGSNGCLAPDLRECDAGWSCESGSCKPPVTICDDMPAKGRCSEFADAVFKCVGSSLISEPCDAMETCVVDEGTQEPKCQPMCPDSCPTIGESACVSDVGPERVCTEQPSGCLKWVQQPCDSGLCSNGECVSNSEVVEAAIEVVDNPEPDDPGDQNMSGGFGKKDGCAAGSEGAPNAFVLCFLLMVVLRLSCRRRPT